MHLGGNRRWVPLLKRPGVVERTYPPGENVAAGSIDFYVINYSLTIYLFLYRCRIVWGYHRKEMVEISPI